MRLPFTALAFLISVSIHSQTTAKVGLIIRTNLTDILVDRYSLGTEVIIQNQFSLGLDLDYISRNVFVGSNQPWYPGTDTHKKGIILEPQARYYLRKTNSKGPYTSISGFFGYAQYSRFDEQSWGVSPPKWLASGFSLHLGHQLSIKRLIIDIYMGVTWAKNRGMGIFYEDRALFPQPDGWRMSGGLRFGFNIFKNM